MPPPALILLVATLMPLASAAVLLCFGARMGAPRSRGGGTALAGWVAATAACGSFLCSLLAIYHWVTNGVRGSPWGWNQQAVLATTRWIPVGDAATGPGSAWLDVGLYVDSLTIAMFAMVTLVALLVHVFSIGYMRGDGRFPRFFAYLSLFTFSMLGLLLAGTLVQVFVFWELVGLCSYLLIGFWTERPAAARAATKAFLVNRVGDAGFLVGFGLLFVALGNVNLPGLWAALGTAGRGGPVTLADGSVVSAGMLTAIGVCLFLGAAGKSAQFPLHTWLPDAMEGPSPVSALIHAATMVAAGVYLMARAFPLLTPDAKLVIAIVGCVTLLLGALSALVQTDIKRALAYSTISQLGYMMLAIGVGSWVGALFHLITHAFFKALLFLSAGSVIHAARHEHDMRKYGGLWRRMPVTAASFLVGVMAISGAGVTLWGRDLGLSGYYSKAAMLTDVGAFAAWATGDGRPGAYWLLFAAAAAAAYLTPFYMTRVWMLTFWGRPRHVPLYGRAREAPMMYVPLMALAFMSAIAGWQILNVRPLLEGAALETTAAAERSSPSRADGSKPTPEERLGRGPLATAWPAYAPGTKPKSGFGVIKEDPEPGEGVTGRDESPPPSPPTPSQQAHAAGLATEHKFVGWAWVVGVLAAVGVYCRGPGPARRVASVPVVRWVRAWLLNGLYLDDLYAAAVVRPVVLVGALAAWLDRHVVDAVVNASAAATRRLSRWAGWNDRQVVDGAVVGVAQLAWEVGAAARAPQTGRVRAYVTALFAIVVIGLAVVVGVMSWR